MQHLSPRARAPRLAMPRRGMVDGKVRFGMRTLWFSPVPCFSKLVRNQCFKCACVRIGQQKCNFKKKRGPLPDSVFRERSVFGWVCVVSASLGGLGCSILLHTRTRARSPSLAKPRQGTAWCGMAYIVVFSRIVNLEAIFSKLACKQCFKFGVHMRLGQRKCSIEKEGHFWDSVLRKRGVFGWISVVCMSETAWMRIFCRARACSLASPSQGKASQAMAVMAWHGLVWRALWS